MLSKNKLIEEKLKNIIILEDAEEDTGNYDWIEDYTNINLWNFLSVNYLELNRFFTLLDIETGPTSGWEKFVEALGLNLWEDRKWCFQYHNGIGPTRAALIKLLDTKKHDENMSLSGLLGIIKEMDRYDILLQIDWILLIDKFKSSNHCDIESKESNQPLIFQLNTNVEKSQMVKSECVTSNAEVSCNEDAMIKRTAKNKVKKKNSSVSCILMTYAPDAEEYALKIANELRKEEISHKRIKILMLGDPALKRVLAVDCTNILHKWFNQVQYVVPVLSPQYLKQIQNIESDNTDQDTSLLNRLVYKFTLDQYVSFRCRNLRCRPICDSAFYSQVKSNSVVKGNGLFCIIWPCNDLQEIKEFGKLLVENPLLP